MQFRETIYALSSGKVPSGVAVVRVSGPSALPITSAMAGYDIEPRAAALRNLRAADGTMLDRGLVLFFRGPHSFTGEDCAEFHLHGGRAVVASVIEAIGAFAATRMAEPGEFTRRAFLNGKMDLVEAEALADLIAAETDTQRRFALASAQGAQSAAYASWRKRIIHALAMMEAELDFSDESDVPGSVADEVWADVAFLIREICFHTAGFKRAEIVREGFRVVILGAPNAGKSSLLNALAKRDVAIVTDEPGTTRDLIDVALDLGGIKVILTDTAGLRDGAGMVEAIGIERALARARDADLVLRLVPADGEIGLNSQNAAELLVRSKCDLSSDTGVDFDCVVSVKTGVGLTELLRTIEMRAKTAIGVDADILPARLRHVELLNRAAAHLERALAMDPAWLELRAEELRSAAKAFGTIAGQVDVEDVLDAVFSEFCIGK
ncbi:MAG TPA: tRNA uridine-5-carboxymethylaminomethyl(34) synthesis GTPase MnmE [Rhizobiaceae bacterium]|nr:tRNA uridine-5-carboxymethylaminomethyl(34) synthesis GTPase MnmE [Rhizobiaceae bacterium]